ncbi:glycosyltransferase involved in cell wall biosynthesis [Nonlabens xylanidelens]|uniref:Glycosyltransferase involved in cell wall biosynthesis n=1 Tax=Nonlabens xylanidelens TaxID=191564 RepID=A0A2S6INP0_9FLAO|nr:glycosyltransferase family 2 protein [Nonlabens xylanidelens]PPK95839.1 glycosyltransferase involved in cell wall biosynthesis [Nonlabens xylanidelens]PQJ22622.1 glycosyltransferase [Nonlabens xylanidelens]
MDLSIVIPLLNEADSIPELQSWINRVMQTTDLSYEVIYIDDGSTDSSWSIISTLSRKREQNNSPNPIKGIKFQANYGKSQALHAGFKMTQGNVVITMDADLQDSPDEIPELYKMITVGNHDLVSGWKKKRYDSVISKNLPSKLFNWAARKTSGVQLNDFNCGLKAYKSAVVKNIDVHGEMHRYIPVLSKNAGFTDITEKEVIHQARKYGTTKFGYERFINGFLDLITIAFISKYGKRPMHLFGTLGVITFMIGFITAGYVGVSKLYRMATDLPYILVTDNPWFFIALTTMVLGTLFFIAGFLGELILRNGNQGDRYKIAEEI